LNWNTENVTIMRCMFEDAVAFNQRLYDNRDTKWALVQSLQQIYSDNFQEDYVDAIPFIPFIPSDVLRYIAEFAFHSWNVKKVTNAYSMFQGASSYKHQLSDVWSNLRTY